MTHQKETPFFSFRYLQFSLETKRIKSSDTPFVIGKVAENSNIGRQIAWDFILKHWNILETRWVILSLVYMIGVEIALGKTSSKFEGPLHYRKRAIPLPQWRTMFLGLGKQLCPCFQRIRLKMAATFPLEHERSPCSSHCDRSIEGACCQHLLRQRAQGNF